MMLMNCHYRGRLRLAGLQCLLLFAMCPLTIAADAPATDRKNLEDFAQRVQRGDRNPSELQALQVEVRSLRDDVRRLSEILEKQRAATQHKLPEEDSVVSNKLPPTRSEQIRTALLRPVSFEFIDVPLIDAILAIKSKIGVNVVIDEGALAEEGVKSTDHVSIVVSGISAQSALKLILDPLNLAYMENDEVLKITSRERAKGPLINATYTLADLIPLLIENEVARTGNAVSPADHHKKILLAIRDLIAKTVSPYTWEDSGGRGTMQFFEPSCSLVINQTHDVHDEVANLLSTIRHAKRLPSGSSKHFDPSLAVMTYSVADLVTHIQDFPGSQTRVLPIDYLRLVDRITTQIEPNNWSQNEGASSILVSEQTYSLIINAKQSMHDEILNLFREMRRDQVPLVTIAANFLTLTNDLALEGAGLEFEFDSRTGMTRISEREAKELLAIANEEPEKVLFAPKITISNGQTAYVGSNLKGEEPNQPRIELHVRGNVSDDRRVVRLSVALNPESLINDLISNSYRVDDGGYLLLEIRDPVQALAPEPNQENAVAADADASLNPLASKGPKARRLILIQPRIIGLEEEEEILVVPGGGAK